MLKRNFLLLTICLLICIFYFLLQTILHMKKLYFLLCFLVFGLNHTCLKAQDHFVLYTGGDNYIPYNFSSNKAQWLYFPAEFTGGVLQPGLITRFYIRAASTISGSVNLPDLTIKIGSTSLTTLVSGPWVGGLTTVFYSASYPQTGTANTWVAYDLQTPFYWDAVSNLIVEISVGVTNAGGFTIKQGGPLTGNRRMYGLTSNPNSSGADYTQASIGFDMTSNCTGSPNAGIVTKTTNRVDCGSTTTLSLSGNSIFPNLQYQWQESYNRTVWNDVGTNATSYTPAVINRKTYYRCVVHCPTSSQTSISAMDSVDINKFPLDLGVDTHLCVNTSFNLSVAGVPNVSTIAWDDNSASATRAVTTPGTYFVTVTQTNGCINADTIKVRSGVEPQTVLPASYNLCEDSVVVLNPGNAGMTFLWNNNATTPTLAVRAPGNYSVQVTSGDKCRASFQTVVTERPLPVNTTVLPFYNICIGDSLRLDGSSTHGVSYNWNDVYFQPVYVVRDSGLYVLQVRSDYGCLTTKTSQVSYFPDPTIRGFTYVPYFYNELKKVVFGPIDPSSVNFYEWHFGDGNSSTLKNPTHTYDAFGDYLVQLYVSNDCNVRLYSQEIRIQEGNTGTGELESKGMIGLYPNPANDLLHINNTSPYKIDQLVVYDVLGREVLSVLRPGNTIDISKVAAGSYVVKIRCGAELTINHKLTVVK